MELGFATMNTPEELHPAALARALEERGFTSLWTGEHSHIPAARSTPYPAGGELPDPYRRMMDPFLCLLLAADATTNLRVGTSVALPLEHDLFALAKSVATLDRLSGGRFDFGVGVGWNVEELADHRPDIAWSSRYRALRGVRHRPQGAVARRGGRAPRALVRLRPGVVGAQAAAAAAPSHRRGDGGSARDRPRGRLG